MARSNLGQLVADEWDVTLREEPDPYWYSGSILLEIFGGPRLTYRERLDRQPRNFYGELIPRIVTVRRNLRQTKGYRATW